MTIRICGMALVLCVACGAWAAETKTPVKPVAEKTPEQKLASPEAVAKTEAILSTDPLTDDRKTTPQGVITDQPIPIIQQIVEFVDATKQPTDWLSWGADLRMREAWSKNNIFLDDSAPGNERHYQRYRFRLWTKIDFTESLSANIRAVWEPRNWCKPDNKLNARDGGGAWDEGEVVFDHMNIEYTDAFNLPLKLTVGRQDIVVNGGWLVRDGTPLDGSRTIYFDAVRAQIELKPIQTQVDIAYIYMKAMQEDQWLPPINDQDRAIATNDEQGVIVNVTNTTFHNQEYSAFFMYKHNEAVNLPYSSNADIYTFGLRAAGKLGKEEHWAYNAQIAKQFGNRNGASIDAFGARAHLGYHFNDTYENKFGLTYEFLSGDDPSTSDDEAFDILWGRYPQFSEIYAYSCIPESGYAQATNLHRVTADWSCKPTEALQLVLAYSLLWAQETPLDGTNPMFGSGHFRGQVGRALLRYRFTDHITGHLVGEIFAPGNYYQSPHDDISLFARYELTITW